MAKGKWRDSKSLLPWLALAAGLWVLAGCSSLCTKHLYLFRDSQQKMPVSEAALLLTDPNLAAAVMPSANLNLQGASWAPEQPFYQTEAYRLNIEGLDGQPVYQGLCLDTLPSYAVEVRPGLRRVALRVDLLGPEGQEKFKEVASLQLEPGKVYFLRPDWQELLSKRLAIKMEILSEPYNAGLRTRVIDWRLKTTKNASLD